MDIYAVLGLLGGLALFLYGMQMMSGGLEDIAGNRMKQILERLTSNRFLGVAVGAVITAVVQSSSATTVMTVGFVNSGMMTLTQAVWIIMGANIGTTITGQLIALDVGLVAPLFAFIGVTMTVFIKSARVRQLGKIFAGFGILFIGMNIMGDAMMPLRDSETFISIMTKFSNPILGILAGALFTATIQSSSASIGILQTLAISGLISFKNAVYVLFGQNIGTCITAVVASIGTNRSAKRTTVIHLLFNVIGTAVFSIACSVLPIVNWVAAVTGGDIARQIANMHTIFNITTTLLLIPFGGLLARLTVKILPDVQKANRHTVASKALSQEFIRGRISLGASAVHTDLLQNEICRIVALAGKNTSKAYSAVLSEDISAIPEIEKSEKMVDMLNKEISQYISKILVNNNSGQNVADIEQYFLITGNAERISDHAINIAGYTEVIKSKNIKFSQNAREELVRMKKITEDALERVMKREGDTTEWLKDVANMEQCVDDMTNTYRENHLERMRQGRCSAEACILYSELLTDFERIGDHILNIAQAYAKINVIN